MDVKPVKDFLGQVVDAQNELRHHREHVTHLQRRCGALLEEQRLERRAREYLQVAVEAILDDEAVDLIRVREILQRAVELAIEVRRKKGDDDGEDES